MGDDIMDKVCYRSAGHSNTNPCNRCSGSVSVRQRLNTRYFRGQVELCRIAREVALEMAEKEKQ